MKRVFAILTVLAVLLSLCACGSNIREGDEPGIAIVEDYTVKIVNADFSNTYSSVNKRKAKEIEVEFEFTNNSKESTNFYDTGIKIMVDNVYETVNPELARQVEPGETITLKSYGGDLVYGADNTIFEEDPVISVVYEEKEVTSKTFHVESIGY